MTGISKSMGFLLVILFTISTSIIILPLLNLNTDSFLLNLASKNPISAVVNFSHNAFFPWSVDSFWLKYFQSASVTFLIGIYLTIFCAGTYLLTQKTFQTWSEPFFLAILLTAFIVSVFGFDVTIISLIAYLPWLILAYSAFIYSERNSFLYALILTFISIRNVETSLYLSIIPASISIFLCWDRSLFTQKKQILALLILLTPAIVKNLSINLPYFPDYPWGKASLVSFDGVAGILRPLFGPEWGIEVIDRNFIRNTFWIPSLLLCILSFYRFSNLSEKNSPFIKKTIYLALILSGLSFLDTRLPESLAQIAPIATLSKLIPGFIFVPLTPIFLSISVFLLSISSSSVLTAAKVPLLFIITVLIFHASDKHTSYTFPLLYKIQKIEISTLNDKRTISPSYKIISDTKGLALNSERFRSVKKRVSPKRFSALLVASENSNSLKFTIDRDLKTHWNTSNQRQTGNEWLGLKLESPQIIDGINLNPGTETANFPRGLRISTLTECKEFPAKESFKENSEKINIPEWIGPVLFTKLDYPFFGKQSDLKIIFAQQILAQCILIEQTGIDHFHDWSIAEISLITTMNK
ncbi:MAG: hypothetical protein SGJ02_04500 [bacterium]|nr:hypothetical protein [bacterium]